MKIVVVGLGVFGYATALDLAANGIEVIAIDQNMSLVESIKDEVAHAVCLDAADQTALKALDIGDADVLVAAIGTNFEGQILAVVNAKKLGVPKIVARAVAEPHAEILRAVGVHLVINPEVETAGRVVQRLLIPDIEGYFELAAGFSVVEVPAPTGTFNRTLKELELRSRFRINVVAFKRPLPATDTQPEGFSFDPIPDPESTIEQGDVLALVGSDLDIAYFMTEMEG